MTNNEIESIIADAEWWVDTIEENKDIDAFYDFVQFCYVYLPALLAEIKRLHKFVDLNHLEKMYRIYREQRLEADNETCDG